ncbi:MAG TPA: peptidase C39 family protein [Nocardioidaceae bacterium]|nr:peptidase C39 family protein [Nocardioidaceae bacterium]
MRLPRTFLAAALTAVLVGPLCSTPADAAPARRIDYQQWDTRAQLTQGRLAGLRVARGRLRIAQPVGHRRYADPYGGTRRSYDFGRWTSPWTAPGFGLTELVPSWDVTTRGDAWVQVEVRGVSETGQRSSWDTLARWAPGDRTVRRTSLGQQSDDLARVAVDTWKSNFSMEFRSWQLRLTLYRRSGTRGTPFVDTIGAMSSNLPVVDDVRTSRPGVARGITLPVLRYSQMIHAGDYPQYGNGGEAWCSPTSTSMVLGYYRRLPGATEYAWVRSPHRNRFVDHAARMTYDYAYRGTGNWSFNTAYAAQHADHAFVTRLRNLREAERFIKAGIPVVASVAFGRGELDGAPISSTNGHLMVIVGFTRAGDVVVNDPAARRNRGVRRTYDRGQFEDAWLPSSGGLAYIIRTGQKLPAGSPGNW